MTKSYNDETYKVVTKSDEKIELMQRNVKISTLVNFIIKNDLEMRIFEETPSIENHIGYVSSYGIN